MGLISLATSFSANPGNVLGSSHYVLWIGSLISWLRASVYRERLLETGNNNCFLQMVNDLISSLHNARKSEKLVPEVQDKLAEIKPAGGIGPL